MSEFNCPIVYIEKITPVPNSDSLEMVTVFETNCIVRKGQLKAGDYAVYIPVESVINMNLPQFQGLGIKVSEGKEKYRVKAVRLRGTYSEGLLVPYPPDEIDPVAGGVYYNDLDGGDMSQVWGITKYEEPERNEPGQVNSKGPQAPDVSWAPRYGVENLLRKRDDLEEGEPVQVTEKIHGCNARFTFGPAKNGIDRLHVGSHNTWRAPIYKDKNKVLVWLKTFVNSMFAWWGFSPPFDMEPINTDDWWTVAKALKLGDKLWPYKKLVFYGEIFGKVQDLKYGNPDGVDLRIFDVYDGVTRTWFAPKAVEALCIELGLKHVEVLYNGPYVKETVDALRTGKSVYDPKTIREGIVIKKLNNEGRNSALKYVSEEYKLRKNPTEYH